MENELATDSILWRVLYFEKFCDIIINKKLFMSQPSSFQDPWELYPPNKWLEEEFWVSKIDSLDEKNLQNSFVRDIAKNLALNIQGMYEFKDDYGISCWSEGQEEKEYLWRLYSSGRNSVAIKTTVQNLLKSFHNSFNSVFLGKVDYIDYKSDQMQLYSQSIYVMDQELSIKAIAADDQILPFMFKRKDFKHENEVRVIKYWNQPNNEIDRQLSIDPNELINEVIISPFADDWFINVVRNLILEKSIITSGQIYKSDLYNKPKELPDLESFLKYKKLKEEFDDQEAGKKWNEEGLFYALFDDKEEVKKMQKIINAKTGYVFYQKDNLTGGIKVTEHRTTGFSKSIKHPTKDKWILPVISLFVEDDLIPLLTREEAEEQGWFHKPRISDLIPWIHGKYITVDKNIVLDRVGIKIRDLTENYLEELAQIEDRKEILYKDPEDKRYWVLTNPEKVQDSTEIKLDVIKKDKAIKKFNLF